MSAIVPVNVIVASAVPSPVRNDKPVTPLSVSAPLVAVSVTCIEPPPASTSAIVI